MSSWDDTFELSSFEWGGKSLIHSVESVRYAFLKRFPSVLVISADGWVSTERASDPELRAVPADIPPSEGILELAFLSYFPGDPDEGNLQPIHVDLEWRDSPEAVHQITVHSNTNQITTMVGRTQTKAHS